MLTDDLRGMWYIMLKDLSAYYFKPPNVSWGILLPLAFALAFAIRDPGNLGGLVPGLLALTLLFGASSMEAIVITFERRIGAWERLLLAPVRLPALLAGKILGGMVFGLATTLVVLILALVLFGPAGIQWLLLLLAMILSAALMLEWLGETHTMETCTQAADLLIAAVDKAFEDGSLVPFELGGGASTETIFNAVYTALNDSL